MTLDTRMYVLDEIDRAEVFAECQRLLSQYDDEKRTPEQQITSHSEDAKGYGRLANRIGQGLPAILDVNYRSDGPYRTPEEAAVHESCNHPDSDYFNPEWSTCTETEHAPPCWLEISWDTAYGFKGPDGIGCGDLHARFVGEMGRWFDARNVRWKWRNEFTGDIHDGYESLISLASGGFEASAWFRSMVLPAITARSVGGA